MYPTYVLEYPPNLRLVLCTMISSSLFSLVETLILISCLAVFRLQQPLHSLLGRATCFRPHDQYQHKPPTAPRHTLSSWQQQSQTENNALVCVASTFLWSHYVSYIVETIVHQSTGALVSMNSVQNRIHSFTNQLPRSLFGYTPAQRTSNIRGTFSVARTPSWIRKI